VSQSIYKLLHLAGILFVFVSVGGLAVHAANGGTRASNALRKLIAGMHGIGLLVVLVAGFGMLAKLGIMGQIPGWVWAKLVIWLLLGAMVIVPYKKPSWGPALLVVLPLLGVLAAYLALYKPF
jgi:uncharacterized membrane protein